MLLSEAKTWLDILLIVVSEKQELTTLVVSMLSG